jgi:hypothetical protein
VATQLQLNVSYISFLQAACKRLPPFCGNIILLVEDDGRGLKLY